MIREQDSLRKVTRAARSLDLSGRKNRFGLGANVILAALYTERFLNYRPVKTPVGAIQL